MWIEISKSGPEQSPNTSGEYSEHIFNGLRPQVMTVRTI